MGLFSLMVAFVNVFVTQLSPLRPSIVLFPHLVALCDPVFLIVPIKSGESGRLMVRQREDKYCVDKKKR